MRARILLLCALSLLGMSSAQAIGTAFTYQGTLEDTGVLPTGTYDLQFRLLNPSNSQIGSIIALDNVTVTNGVFTVQLDFGANIFTGFDRLLEIGVRPGVSTGAYTILTPNTPLNPAPYAQTSANSQIADEALGVAASSIFESDFASGSVSSRAIAAGAVTNSELGSAAVTNSKIGPSAVDTTQLTDSAVTNAKVESGSILPSRLAGQLSTYGIAVTVGANSCNTYSVSFGGDVVQNDIPLLTLADNSTLPSNLFLQALRVSADNTIELRACNVGNTSQSSGNISVRLVTFR